MIRWFSSPYLKTTLVVVTIASTRIWAATPTVEQAMKLRPMQQDIEIDVLTKEEIAKSSIRPEKSSKHSALVVRDPEGRLLRQFVDSNADGKIDQWRYFREGIEVYRDIDEDFNAKADQYRWLGTAGTRWGLDDDEDGKIDSWKAISAEEVSAQVIEAVKRADARQFQNGRAH